MSLQRLYLLNHLIISPHMFLNKKNSENGLCLKKFDEIKPNEISRHLNLSCVWFIQLSTHFYHAVRFTTNLYFRFIIKLATIVEGDPRAPFSIATPPRCTEGRYSFPWIAPLYSASIPFNAERQTRRHQLPFSSLWYDSTWEWTPVSRVIGKHSNC